MENDIVEHIIRIKEDTGYLRAAFDDLETRMIKVELESQENSRWIWRAIGGGTMLYTVTSVLILYLKVLFK
jgi:hypothetical protein